jgi:hypothetical protein
MAPAGRGPTPSAPPRPLAPALHAPQLPCDKLFELPGRPNVLYTLKNYSYDKVKGAVEARGEAGFLFKVGAGGARCCGARLRDPPASGA